MTRPRFTLLCVVVIVTHLRRGFAVSPVGISKA
jgi:hypothetical protein